MLPLAKILKSNGVDGDLLIGAIDIEVGEIDIKEPVFIEFEGLPVPFFIDVINPKGPTKAIIHLSGIDSLEDAEELVGRQLCVEGDAEGDDDYEDFTGWDIYDSESFIGKATGMQEFPGHVCICIGDVLLPLHEDLVLSCDPETRTLVLDLPQGLTEL